MDPKVFFLIGVAGVGGWVWNSASNYDPTIFDMTKQEVEAKLTTAVSEIEGMQGGTVRIYPGMKTSGGVTIMRQFKDGNYVGKVNSCKARITELEPGKTQVIADCSDPTSSRSSSAQGRTLDEYGAVTVQEHIYSQLLGKPYNVEKAKSQKVRATMQNMGDMRQEALETADRMKRY